MVPATVLSLLMQISNRGTPLPHNGYTYCGNVEYLFEGWKIRVFIDCDEWDYIDSVVSPDGEEVEFWPMATPEKVAEWERWCELPYNADTGDHTEPEPVDGWEEIRDYRPPFNDQVMIWGCGHA